jgi:hypothetical protein
MKLPNYYVVNSLFPILPYTRQTSYRKSCNLSEEKPKTNLPKYLMSRATGGFVEKSLVYSHHTANLNFLFLSFSVYLLKKSPPQILSHLELTEPVFCSEELSFLPYKNQNQNLTLSSLAGKKNWYGENLY